MCLQRDDPPAREEKKRKTTTWAICGWFFSFLAFFVFQPVGHLHLQKTLWAAKQRRSKERCVCLRRRPVCLCLCLRAFIWLLPLLVGCIVLHSSSDWGAVREVKCLELSKPIKTSLCFSGEATGIRGSRRRCFIDTHALTHTRANESKRRVMMHMWFKRNSYCQSNCIILGADGGAWDAILHAELLQNNAWKNHADHLASQRIFPMFFGRISSALKTIFLPNPIAAHTHTRAASSRLMNSCGMCL